MPLPLVPVLLLGGAALATIVALGKDKTGTPAGPTGDPLDANLPADVRASVLANLSGNANPNELWQLAVMLYANGYPKASQAVLGRANQVRAGMGLPALPFPPPAFQSGPGPVSPGQPVPPPPAPPGLPQIPPLPPSPLPQQPGLPAQPQIPPPGPTPPFVPPAQPPVAPGVPAPSLQEIQNALNQLGLPVPGIPAQPQPPVAPSIPIPRPPAPMPPPPAPMPAGKPLPDGAYWGPDGRVHYKTQPGDFGAKIAAKFGQTNVPELVANNPGKGDWSKMGVGTDLLIPVSWTLPYAKTAIPAVPSPMAPPAQPMPGVPVQIPGFPAITPSPAPAQPSGPPLPVGAVRGADGQVIYSLQPGDWGASPVAKRFGKTDANVPELLKENPGYPWGPANRGQPLKIPRSWA